MPRARRKKLVPRKKKFINHRKKCYFTTNNIEYIDYKNIELLSKFIGNNGKILPREVTGTEMKHQRKLSSAIKKAIEMALLPYTNK